MADGSLKPAIDQVFAFDELPAARAAMEADTQVGKIVVRMPD
ncbi:MAG: zinc-binding dehydrogenase [Burkholderiales bacterium]